ncbi:dTDP-4-dehydrorhamnose 3,5-epimerase [Neisseria weaveri]|uniref:dTDP-4-dehydrorhamnose 3,5-epimerase n=1 Tax=Neisseria weaveri TaxID=28091 RepID=A0A3S4ZK00_9NEIS|nr:dTDP-4-dehydrorhamnose 3,5-epimerase [Neisseria weaveri]EGV38584.1 dTDP-4-dehydrorhamnose 3,5-epimerase [Neisseria weaveri LMG 5135]VEJ50169.1 dTDP-6-deoxy-L-mannose-dehydrogenase [Neisseria weaveri]
MKIIDTCIPDVKILRPEIFTDERGCFMETFREAWFEQYVGRSRFVQENHSRSESGVLRGLHYQMTQPQGKLVRAVSGSVFDVAVDMRRSSPYFGKWAGGVLSAENGCQMWIPEGFAHGFCVIGSGPAELVYKCTDYYHPQSEQVLRWDDETVGINWPSACARILSDKDKAGRALADAVCFD